ncbi:DUF1009 domain-containing protein [Arsenicitalea aurantiaca]|uniref:DUF1009 domain-containing protein n=1 Tax=Arsenicitalea aurantiaca TaxID=1783274 RepID=A0A433XF54_9HYPH|nr:LpxI family protein [Arsenicitalea aurantiaca]RUT32731.1 DUF1009 domain-containing protein [Arsenicitalea aurantiaca]
MAGRLTIFAGTGALVPLAIDAARRGGYRFQVLTLVPRDDLGDDVKTGRADLENPLGIVFSLKMFRTTHILLVGGVTLSDRVREGLARLGGGGGASSDSVGDGALSGVARTLKTMTGADLIGIENLAPELLAPVGHIAGPPAMAPQSDLAFAMQTAREVGRLDLGQAVATTGRRVLAVEDIAGTDALIARIGQFRRAGLTGDGEGAIILAKAAKPAQPLFVDLPAIGPVTIDNARAAGIVHIAVQAGRTLLIERGEISARADALGISVVGVPAVDA